jgi:MFS family permease
LRGRQRALRRGLRLIVFRIRDKNIWGVYQAILLVGVAYGVYVSLLAIHLDARGFSKQAIGSFATWFAAGIIVFSLPAGAALRRVSAKTLLVASLLGYAACAAAFPYLTSYAAIAAARLLDGAFSVGVWVSCETVLLRRAERGRHVRLLPAPHATLAAGPGHWSALTFRPLALPALSIGSAGTGPTGCRFAQWRCSDGSPKRWAVSPPASNWMSTAGSRPTTQASWPGSSTTTSGAVKSKAQPSPYWPRTCPELRKPTCPCMHSAVPTIGFMCVDQRNPGGYTTRLT